MKRHLVAVVLIVFVVASMAMADELKLTEFSLGAGKSAFTSGLDATARFANGQYDFEFVGNSDRFYGVAFWKTAIKGLNAGICAGTYKNQPQIGPYITYAPLKFASIFYWKGWGFGKPEHPSWKISPFFEASGIAAKMGGLKLRLVRFIFMGEKTWLPGASFGISIRKNFRFAAGVDYKTLTKESLFWMRVGYFLK